MTITFGARRLCLWMHGIHRLRDLFSFAWHGRRINPTFSMCVLGLVIELRRAAREGA